MLIFVRFVCVRTWYSETCINTDTNDSARLVVILAWLLESQKIKIHGQGNKDM